MNGQNDECFLAGSEIKLQNKPKAPKRVRAKKAKESLSDKSSCTLVEEIHPVGNTETISLIAPLQKNTVLVQVGRCKTSALVDTGAAISCISKSLIDKSGMKFTLKAASLTHVLGVGGEHIKVLGKLQIPVKISGLKFQYQFHILEKLHHSLILGADFLRDKECVVDLGQGKLHLQNFLAVAAVSLGNSAAKTDKPICIPARSEIEICVSVPKSLHKQTILLEPAPTNFEFRASRCLTNVKKGKAFLRILNPTKSEINLPSKSIVASVTLIDSNNVFTLSDTEPQPSFQTETCANINTCTQHNVSNDLQPSAINFNISSKNLTKEQCAKLNNFLNQNSDVFSTSLETLGKTNVFSHRIETEKSAKPVHMRCYRQSPELKAETERQVIEMLDQNLISPSTSVWNSPVVLVRKKDNTWRFAIDYRKLNKITIPISHPLPRLEDVFDSIGESSATIFST